MEQINLDALSNEVVNTDYYKKLQKSLRKKHIENLKSNSDSTIAKENTIKQSKEETHKTTIPKPTLDDLHFKDEVILSKKKKENEKNDRVTTTQNIQQTQTAKEKFKYNAKDILRSLGYKIDFHAKKNELKEMYKFNLQESNSHNLFASRFARFKVGIVNQILAAIGVPVEELNKLKKECESEFIEQNNLEMSENIYNIELNEIMNGRGRKSKQYTKMFSTIQHNLIVQMNNLGKIGFWSKARLYEEKIKQCKKIKQEFVEEMQHLEYLLGYANQKKVK